jgi:hypothetical protein
MGVSERGVVSRDNWPHTVLNGFDTIGSEG